MELKRIQDIFAEDLLELSPKASELIDILWILYRIGASVPMSFISFRMNNIEEKIKSLVDVGLVKLYAHGVVTKKDDTKPKAYLSLDDDFKAFVTKETLTKELFRKMVFEYTGKKLIRLCQSQLTDFVVTFLGLLVFYASPKKPFFIGKVVRDANKKWSIHPSECKDILNVYLEKFLDLVKVDGAFVNFSDKAIEKLKKDEEVFKIYADENKPKEIKIF